jgi:anti-sigma B factor antagonist
MNFQRQDDGTRTTLRIEGSLDALSTPELRPMIDSILNDKRNEIIVDVSGLRLIDSSGVGALVSLYKRARAAGGNMSVSGLRDQPLVIFKLLKLDRILVS